ncbi:hypothetical protein [Olleya sp. HaHaR_3_96]|uniref:hypothetical protein n=1 Tax=Olleya sp. HaHaR_3_96 TaxID=2745560 RepID=UPI001C4F98E0|nr:hypothetical protein [Olleya sp. HaHaR_3_96]QXP58690.1 hypothetical protein H0I26_12285 [Olleya sp. HaHaR_3_96]
MDWNSFWINILAGSVYFILGILVSIWLIPKYTIRLLKRKNINHFRTKITFIISELCYFLNSMPQEFKVNKDSTTFLVKNKKYNDLFDFVALLNPNIFKPVAPEQLNVKILETIAKYSGEKRHDFIKSELDKLKFLKDSLDEILSSHSLNIDDKIISSISTLCIEIKLMNNEFRFNSTHEELTGEKEGLSGSIRLDKIYSMIIELLNLLENEDGIKRE